MDKNCDGKYVTMISRSCNGRGKIPINKKKYYMISSDEHDIVKVVMATKFDPPLRVVKCRQGDQEVNLILSKRRGIDIKSLHIQPNQVIMNQQDSDVQAGF